MAPPNLGFVLVSFTGKFADVLGSIACKLITSFSIIFHVIILHAPPIFFRGSFSRGITRFKDKSTSRGSRPSYSRGLWRLPTPFFLSRSRFPLSVEKLQKLPLTSLQTPREWKNRTLLEKFYTFDEVIPPEGELSTKSRTAIDTMQSVKIGRLYDQ